MENLNLTALETKFLQVVINETDINEPEYSCLGVEDVAEITGISINILRGVGSSLVQKGIISILNMDVESPIIYLNSYYFYLLNEN